MDNKEIKELIDFFNNIEVEEKTLEENKGVLKVQVTYKLNPEFFKKFEEFKDFKNFEFTTAELCYKDISKVEVKDVKDKDEVLKFFGRSVYWLDINEHDWPSDTPNIDDIIEQISNGNEDFKVFLDKLYDNIREITREGTSSQYGNNLVTNNHWHDIVKLIKLFIDKKGDVNFYDEEVKPYFERMVFMWYKGERTSLHPKFGLRSFLDALFNNIKKVSHIMKKEEISHIMKKEEIKNLLEYKKQVILQGAPGTGKTYIAKEIADEMTKEGGEWKIIQFHPSYTYEDFVRGIVTEVINGTISYKVTNKILAEFAKKAKESSDKKFVLIIDEINRANLPSVLGELIYALEYRGEEVESMYNHSEYGQKISLPENLYIIGTMNTTDRSIGHIDYAIRRRFAFYTLTADKSVIEEEYKNNENLKDKALELFDKIKNLIKENISPDYSIDDVMIGHSYFLAKDEEKLKMKLEYEIKPILLEYYKDGILIDNRNNDNKESLIEQIKNLSLESKQNNQEKTQDANA